MTAKEEQRLLELVELVLKLPRSKRNEMIVNLVAEIAFKYDETKETHAIPIYTEKQLLEKFSK